MSNPQLPQAKQPRYKLHETEQGIMVTIPYPKKAVKTQLLIHSVACWLLLFMFIPSGNRHDFWFGVLIIGAMAWVVLWIWLSSLFTREIIRVSPQEFQLELRGPLRRWHLYAIRSYWYKQRPYPLYQVTNLRVLMGSSHPGVLHGMIHPHSFGPLFAWTTRSSMATMGPTLAIDYEPVPGAVITERFAMGLDEHEARMLWRVIAKRFPEIARNNTRLGE